MKNKWEENYYQLASGETPTELDSERWKKVLRYLSENLKGGDRVLEIGCGVAGLSGLIDDDVKYVGLDSSDHALEKGRKKISNRENITLVKGSSDQLPFEEKSFDMVFAVFSLEHFSEPEKSLCEMVRVLKKDGSLIIFTPNLEFPFSFPFALRHKRIFFRISFYFLRLYDYFARIFGVYNFRIIKENYLQATGEYELADDDLVYLASSYEIINFLKKKQKMKIEYINRAKYFSSLKGFVKKLITFFPAMRYYGDILFIIAKK